MSTSVTAIVLAAGASRRFGAVNKLLADIDGATLLARVVDRLHDANLDEVIAVTQPAPASDAIVSALANLRVRCVPNRDHAQGIGTSIRCGVSAAAVANGLMIVPADMPGLDPMLLARLIERFRGEDGRRIIVPVNATGAQRNPVIWPAALRAELLALDGDSGGKPLLAAHTNLITQVQWSDERAFEDIDTAADLSAYRRAAEPGQPVRSKP